MSSLRSIDPSQITRPQTPSRQFLDEAETDGRPGISMEELNARVSRGNLPAGMTQGKVNGLKASFLNTLEPQSGRGGVQLSPSSNVVIPSRGDVEIQETLGSFFASLPFGRLAPAIDIRHDGETLGTIKREYATEKGSTFKNLLVPTLVLEAPDGTVVARAVPKFFDLRVNISLYDGDAEPGEDAPFAIIRQSYSDTLTSVLQRAMAGGTIYTNYDILDANERPVAESEKVEFFSTKFDLQTRDGTSAGRVKRPWLDLGGNSWEMTPGQPGTVDRRVIAFVAAYKTLANQAKRSEAFWETVAAAADAASR